MTNPLFLLLGATLIAVSGGLGWLLAARRHGREHSLLRREHTALQEEHNRLREELVRLQSMNEHQAETVSGLEDENARLRAETARLGEELTRSQTRQEEQRRAHEEKLAELETVRRNIEKELESVTARALKDNQDHFLKAARQYFEEQRKVFASEGKQRSESVENLLKPMSETLKRYQENLSKMEKEQQAAYGSILNEMKNVIEGQISVRNEAARLVSALRSAPKARGIWGEQQLRNCLELAGMTQHVDFLTEQSFNRDEERLRPDVIIRLPAGRTIIIDAKAPMSAYLDAMEAETEEERDALLRQHATHVRQHMRELSKKDYWNRLTDTVDFVAMFLPGENFYAAAMEKDPALLEDAVRNRVLIVSPTTLIALAKVAAYGWRQESVAENARRIAALGEELHKRLRVMGEHVGKLGKGIQTTVNNYNSLVGSLEHKVLPQARRFEDIEAMTISKPIAGLEPVDASIRQPRDTSPAPLPVAGDDDGAGGGDNTGKND